MTPDPRPRENMKLLPFPWIFATRKLARRLIEHIESCHRIIARQQAENLTLQSRLNELGGRR